MRYESGTTNVPAAGTRVRVSNTKDRVLWIRFSARQGNTDGAFVGTVTVSATVGRELRPPETANAYGNMSQTEYRPSDFEGTLFMNVFYVDADTNDNKVDYEAFFADGIN